MSDRRYVIDPVKATDRAAWQELFTGYCRFYGVDPTPEHLDRVWNWLQDAATTTSCLLARTSTGEAVGLAQYRSWLWPLRGETACFLDDLYVAVPDRRAGVGRALLSAVADGAAARGEPVVRWMTREDNVTARRTYDAVAEVMPVVTYEWVAGRSGDPL